MQVKPYEDSGDKKAQVEQMFDNIAGKYDFLNRFLSLGIDTLWRKQTLKQIVDVGDVQKMLDVATGTADLAIEAHNSFGIDDIVGLDLSNEMLEVGRKKLVKKGYNDNIELIKGDSEALPFEDETFDVVTAAFGVRNFGDLKKGLSEMQRVLKKNGQIVILEFSRPNVFPIKQIFNLYFKNILPVIGKMTSKDESAYDYLYKSVQAFPDYDRFLHVLDEVGFKERSWKALSFGICCIYVGFKR